MGLDISKIYTDHDSNIIGCHRNALLPDEGSNTVYNPYLDTASKPNLGITKCDKYLFNDLLNLNINTPSYKFEYKDYGTPKSLPKDMKETQLGGISFKEDNRT